MGGRKGVHEELESTGYMQITSQENKNVDHALLLHRARGQLKYDANILQVCMFL